MNHSRSRRNGTSYVGEHRTSIVHALRGDLPPAPGVRWLLDTESCRGQLTTSHPILGVRAHRLRVSAGTLTGLADAQFELTLALGCANHRRGAGREANVLFRSTSVARPETFRYIVKGALQVGEARGIGVIRIHDLSWTATGDSHNEARILTMSATVERRFWDHRNGMPTPWLTRDAAEVFVHTEWRAATDASPAA
jgi:hypothetical protein